MQIEPIEGQIDRKIGTIAESIEGDLIDSIYAIFDDVSGSDLDTLIASRSSKDKSSVEVSLDFKNGSVKIFTLSVSV
jgi:hypothetical protein